MSEHHERRIAKLEKQVAEMQADFVKNNLVAREAAVEQMVTMMEKTFTENNLLARVIALEAAGGK